MLKKVDTIRVLIDETIFDDILLSNVTNNDNSDLLKIKKESKKSSESSTSSIKKNTEPVTLNKRFSLSENIESV